jgi:Ni/Fe-hydrogenase subunit HybB-like protein
MVIAPYKLHHLWWTPISPLLFLLSAIMVGFPMVIFTMLFASWSLKRKPEMEVLSALARYVPVFLTIYLAVKVSDVIARGVWPDLFTDPYHGSLWLAEVLLGVVVPLVLLFNPRVRHSPLKLGIAMLMVILGVVLNRLNCFVLAYHPPFATKTYVPSIAEFGVSMGLIAALMLTYRLAVTYLPILEPRQSEAA